jgi:acyl-ACP thioesterase
MTATVEEVYRAPYRVRFDEAGPDGRLRSSAVLRYAQDLAWLHSAAAGFGRSWYAEHRLTWLVRAAELQVLAPIQVGATLTGTTQVVGFRRVWSRRRSEFRGDDDTLAAWIHIDWVLLDERGAPTRIPSIFEELFQVPATPLVLGRVPLPVTPDDTYRTQLTVRPQELDPMDHVNNAVYADWLDEAVIAAGDTEATRVIPRTVSLEYALPAAPGAQLEGVAWPSDGGWSYRLTDVAGADLLRARLAPARIDP